MHGKLRIPSFLSFISMSKKIFAALSMSLFLAACNSTADVTTDDESMMDDDSMMMDDSSASSVDAMMDESSSSSDDSMVDGAMDAEVEVTQ